MNVWRAYLVADITLNFWVPKDHPPARIRVAIFWNHSDSCGSYQRSLYCTGYCCVSTATVTEDYQSYCSSKSTTSVRNRKCNLIAARRTGTRGVTCITAIQTGVSVTPHEEPEDAILRDVARHLPVSTTLFAHRALGFRTAGS